MQKERIHWVDIARGIGIIFVIYAHVLGSHGYRYWFYAFHMPLFFFLSGVVFKDKGDFKTFFKKSVKGLLIPYFIFAFIMYFWWVFSRGGDYFSGWNISQFLSIFYGNGNTGLVFNDVLWFLPALFVTRIIFELLLKLSKDTKILGLFLICFSILGYLISVFYNSLKLPFGTETALSAVVFYGAGFLWFRSEKAREIVSKYKVYLFPLLIILMSILATIGFHIFGHQIDMRINRLNNYFLFYLDAFSGTVAFIAFSMMINKNSLLENLGKNSLILFAWHPIVFDYLRLFLNSFPSLVRSFRIFIPGAFTVVSISLILSINSLYKRFREVRGKFS